MIDPNHPIANVLRKDNRYKLDAYAFIFDALRFAQDEMGLGNELPSEPVTGQREEEEGPQRHVTGPELCQAIKQLAIDQYGLMAKTVLNNWGIRNTGDVGEIVFNLIRAGQMRKTSGDRREDFDNVFDFDQELRRGFKIVVKDVAEA